MKAVFVAAVFLAVAGERKKRMGQQRDGRTPGFWAVGQPFGWPPGALRPAPWWWRVAPGMALAGGPLGHGRGLDAHHRLEAKRDSESPEPDPPPPPAAAVSAQTVGPAGKFYPSVTAAAEDNNLVAFAAALKDNDLSALVNNKNLSATIFAPSEQLGGHAHEPGWAAYPAQRA
jgi:hypothetical protein